MERRDSLRKPLDLATRWIHLATRRRGRTGLSPNAAARRFTGRPARRVLVLQSNDNATVAYYLRPRLARSDVDWAVVNLERDPWSPGLLDHPDDLLVIICRYIDEKWLRALEATRDRLNGVVFLVDDDLSAMMDDPTIPWRARGKVAVGYGRFAPRLEAIVSEIWTSTPALAATFPGPTTVLAPLPCDPPAVPSPSAPPLVVYHGTDVHGPERAFAADLARRLLVDRPDIRFEITGDRELSRACADLPNVTVTPQVDWPTYLAEQQGRSAALFLAPMRESRANAVRAPVKVFDAARLGACGVYADAPPYRDAVRHGIDGLLLPMDPAAWARAVQSLIDAPDQRLRMARAAEARIRTLMADAPPLPINRAAP